jgi:hypothetical protein
LRFERWLYSIPLRVRSLFRRDDVEQELDDELQFHIEQKTQQYAAARLKMPAAKLSATLTVSSSAKKNAGTLAASAGLRI